MINYIERKCKYFYKDSEYCLGTNGREGSMKECREVSVPSKVNSWHSGICRISKVPKLERNGS